MILYLQQVQLAFDARAFHFSQIVVMSSLRSDPVMVMPRLYSTST